MMIDLYAIELDNTATDPSNPISREMRAFFSLFEKYERLRTGMSGMFANFGEPQELETPTVVELGIVR